MIVKFIGETEPGYCVSQKEYEVKSIEGGWYRVIDSSEEDYLYPSDVFVLVGGQGKKLKDLKDGLKAFVKKETGIDVDKADSKSLDKAYKSVLKIAIDGTREEEDMDELSEKTRNALEVIGVPNEWYPDDE